MIFKIKLNQDPVLNHPSHQHNLLTTLQQVGHYSECRNGYCGACRVRLIAGKVRYIQSPLAYLKPNEILPCCCQPLTDLTLESIS